MRKSQLMLDCCFLQGAENSGLEVSIAPEVLRQLAEAEAARGTDSTPAKDVKELEKQMVGHRPS
jgi:hypothetical protein